jgi:hypothetical protein
MDDEIHCLAKIGHGMVYKGGGEEEENSFQ